MIQRPALRPIEPAAGDGVTCVICGEPNRHQSVKCTRANDGPGRHRCSGWHDSLVLGDGPPRCRTCIGIMGDVVQHPETYSRTSIDALLDERPERRVNVRLTEAGDRWDWTGWS